MDRIVTRRLVIRGAVLAILATPVAVGMAGSASAAPTPSPTASTSNVSNAIAIEGEGLTSTLTITAADRQRDFEALLSEVDWLLVRPGVTKSPAPDKLGPKYTVTVLADGVAKQQYDLYPLATGGPRAYRSDKQPDKRKVTAAWFYGRLSMPATLRTAGVPLSGVSLPPGAGGGGGGGATGEQVQNLDSMFGQWRGVVALNGAVALLIAAGLFAIAFGIRRKV